MSMALYYRNQRDRGMDSPEAWWAARDRRIELARGDSVLKQAEPAPNSKPKLPMQEAQYINEIACLCSDEKFGQDAVEWGVLSGQVELTHDRETDLEIIMGRPGGDPKTPRLYDQLVEQYQRTLHEALLLDNPLLDLMEQIQTFPVVQASAPREEAA